MCLCGGGWSRGGEESSKWVLEKEHCSSLEQGSKDLLFSTPAASSSSSSKQLAASSGTVLGPHNGELCHTPQALASGKFSVLKCLLYQLDAPPPPKKRVLEKS